MPLLAATTAHRPHTQPEGSVAELLVDRLHRLQCLGAPVGSVGTFRVFRTQLLGRHRGKFICETRSGERAWGRGKPPNVLRVIRGEPQAAHSRPQCKAHSLSLTHTHSSDFPLVIARVRTQARCPAVGCRAPKCLRSRGSCPPPVHGCFSPVLLVSSVFLCFRRTKGCSCTLLVASTSQQTPGFIHNAQTAHRMLPSMCFKRNKLTSSECMHVMSPPSESSSTK